MTYLKLPIENHLVEGGQPLTEVFFDKIFFTNDLGQAFVVQAGRTFKLLRVNELRVQVLASPRWSTARGTGEPTDRCWRSVRSRRYRPRSSNA